MAFRHWTLGNSEHWSLRWSNSITKWTAWYFQLTFGREFAGHGPVIGHLLRTTSHSELLKRQRGRPGGPRRLEIQGWGLEDRAVMTKLQGPGRSSGGHLHVCERFMRWRKDHPTQAEHRHRNLRAHAEKCSDSLTPEESLAGQAETDYSRVCKCVASALA